MAIEAVPAESGAGLAVLYGDDVVGEAPALADEGHEVSFDRENRVGADADAGAAGIDADEVSVDVADGAERSAAHKQDALPGVEPFKFVAHVVAPTPIT